MDKTIIGLMGVWVLLFASCTYVPQPQSSTVEQPRDGAFTRIVKIRNCEYIEFSMGSSQYSYGYIHCGDCTNPTHTQK